MDLGMQSVAIADSQITASSSSSVDKAPKNARLGSPGAWSPSGLADQWIGVNLGVIMQISGITTQGREGPPTEYVTKYRVEYSYDGDFWLALLAANNQDKVCIMFEIQDV